VNEALLLPAWHGVIAGIKVRNQNSFEVSQQFSNQKCFARIGELEDYVQSISQNPNILILALNIQPRLVHMDYRGDWMKPSPSELDLTTAGETIRSTRMPPFQRNVTGRFLATASEVGSRGRAITCLPPQIAETDGAGTNRLRHTGFAILLPEELGRVEGANGMQHQ
jgi:hypothetical protein